MLDPASEHLRAVAEPRARTYVVLAFTLPFGSGAIAPLGTIVAPTLSAAYLLAEPFARARGHHAADVVLRVRRASACRRAWLLEALARDGAAAT